MTRLSFIVLLGIAHPALAGELTSSGPLAIRAPGDLVLGRDTTAVIHVRVDAGIRLVTSAGTLGGLSDGAATLTLPDERFPQLAIVAAVAADGTVRDWLAIPLAGQARVKVDTESRASVVVRVGTTEFGPVRADAAGVAQVEIVVPPGIVQATTIATGSRGAIRDKVIPLGVLPFRRILALCGAAGDVSVIATQPNGAPAPAAPHLTASTGVLGPVSSSAPGLFVSIHDDANVVGDSADIAASFPGEDAVSCRLQVPPEAPHAIRITTDRPQFVAGSGAVTLSIALDYHGKRRPLAISEVTLDAATGSIAALQRTDTGWSAVWTVPDGFAGQPATRAMVRATVPHGELRATIDLPLIAAAPARIEATAPTRLRGNGSSAGVITAHVLDRFGNVVASPNLVARAHGRVAAFTAQSTAHYVTPYVRDSGDDVIELSEPSGVTGRARIGLEGVGRRFAYSARLGYLSNLARVSTPIAAVSADLRLPMLDDRLIAGIELAGYSASVGAQTMDLPETVSGRVTAMPALVRVAYRRSLGAIDLWFGGGAGAAFTSSRLSSESSGTTQVSATRFAATGFFGAARRTGPGWIVVEGAYLHATLDGPIAGRIGGVIATAGFAIER